MKSPLKPKRRNAAKSKATILDAAQKSFSELGFSQAGIRDIAAVAGVSSTLLLRYYGSKARLFEAALIDAMRLQELLAQGRDGFGQRLADLFLDAAVEITAPSMVVLSSGHAEAREIGMRVTRTHVLGPLADWLGPPDARERAAEIIMLSTGFLFYTRQIPLLPARRGGNQGVSQWFVRAVQTIVDRS
jgi:AcrR family transcriptional regulator